MGGIPKNLHAQTQLTVAIALCSSRAVDIQRTYPSHARDTSTASLRDRERPRSSLYY